jgi:hypothetical protein
LVEREGGAPVTGAAAPSADGGIEIEVAMKRLSLWLAVCAIALLSGAVCANAFTIETYGNNGSGLNLTDPDETAPMQRLTDSKNSSSSSSGINFLGGKLNFSGGASGASQNGANSAFGARNYYDPSQPPAVSSGFSNGPFGMFGPRY